MVYASMFQIDDRIRAFDRKIVAVFNASEVSKCMATIRGIGAKTAAAIIAAIGDGASERQTSGCLAPAGVATALERRP